MCIRDRHEEKFQRAIRRWTRGEEVMLSTMTTSEKSKDVINQVAETFPPNSEKIIMGRTEVDTRGNQCSIFETQKMNLFYR